MNDEIKKAVRKSKAAMQEAHPSERATFKALLLSNPNYFGNLVDVPFKPVVPVCCNTHYEELACVGYQPQDETLEAVVYVYQPTGYGTDVCGAGTPEYVRFYLSYDSGTTWHDQGMTSFQAYNIPEGTEGGKRLEYAASLAIDPTRRFCWVDPLVEVRAILSWNDAPPPNQPNWKPVWGNVREETILLEPLRLIFPGTLFKVAKLKLPFEIEEALDLEAPIATKKKVLDVAQLAALYEDKGVPAHRFAYKEIAAFTAGPQALAALELNQLVPGIQIDPDIIDKLYPKTDGDTSYEELKCIGLDPILPDTLVGVLQLKKPTGFSGGPCTSGSREYVTFWGDFDDDGAFEECLGTADVRVYDLSAIPPQGVSVAVRLPVDLDAYRQACADGPRVVRIRAILSWNVPAPCSNPNHVPTWGNREETLIHIAPGIGASPGEIAILGGIPVSHIDAVSGLTTASAIFATNNLPPDPWGRPCPFAGRVTVQGAPVPGHTYKVEVIPSGGGAPTPVVADLILTRQDGTTHVHAADPVTGRFTYLPFNQNVNGVLAQWNSTGDALWRVRLSTFDGAGNLVGTDEHLIQLDNTWPDASVDITSGLGNCGKFTAGAVLSGDFIARDLYLRNYSLRVEPVVNPAGVGIPVPSSGTVQTAPAPGDGWTLDTTGMQPCGYVIRIVTRDRAIVNSQSVGHWRSDSAGFCIEAEVEE